MYKELLIFLLLVHILGDFYFQTESMAIKKEEKFKYVVLHSIIYGLVTIFSIKFVCLSFDNIYLWILVISHFVIDSIKYYLKKYNGVKKQEKYVFFIDQMIHFIIMMLVCYVTIKSGKICVYNPIILDVLNIMGIYIQTIIVLFLQILLIHKPVNIFIVNIMKSYKPTEKNAEDTIKAGRIIGTIERIIMLFFLSIQQYSSVGLVLTAKSIARYNKISENQEFAEYYLLGTLLSTICVLIISLI